MKKLVLNVVLMLVAINAAIFLGTYVAGKPFEFNYIFNLVTPVICAVAAWETEQRKSKQQ